LGYFTLEFSQAVFLYFHDPVLEFHFS